MMPGKEGVADFLIWIILFVEKYWLAFSFCVLASLDIALSNFHESFIKVFSLTLLPPEFCMWVLHQHQGQQGSKLCEQQAIKVVELQR